MKLRHLVHSLDVWHKAEKLSKVLPEVCNKLFSISTETLMIVEQASKKRELAELGPWKRSIVNHFWWIANKQKEM